VAAVGENGKTVAADKRSQGSNKGGDKRQDKSGQWANRSDKGKDPRDEETKDTSLH